MRQRQLLAPLFIVVMAGIGACGDDHGTNPTSNAGLISGQVIEFSTQKPAAGTALVFQSRGDDSHMATTDASGMYTVALPTGMAQLYNVTADGTYIGIVQVRPAGRVRGDLMVDHVGCVSRYGVVYDADTLMPVAGATVTLRNNKVVTGADGWYRLDLVCPDPGVLDFGTTFIYVTRADYADGSFPAGRGVHNVIRDDIPIKRK